MFTGDRGGEIRHRLARDAAGRLTAKETADSRTEYVHDAADQLLEIRRRRSDAGETDAPEVIRFSYDRLGRMLTEETAQGVLTHQYDELSNRTATTFPDGRTQRHLYYGSGHLQQINLDREVISEFTRDALHREVLRSQGRLSTRQLYDPGGRLKRRETYSGMRGVVPETFTDRQYSYSGEDELLKTRHSRRGETDYFYDPTGRITACRSEDEGYLASWQYDAAGNLLGRRAGEAQILFNFSPARHICRGQRCGSGVGEGHHDPLTRQYKCHLTLVHLLVKPEKLALYLQTASLR
ncbi:YD repeat-containing protein [Escherichia coli]|nr:YD repeat-containing protein [Escherichia coli]